MGAEPTTGACKSRRRNETEEGKMARETGTVKWFNEQKGYGFIVRESGERDLFVHHSAIIAEGFRTLAEGDRVEFTVTQGQKGPAADQVRKI